MLSFTKHPALVTITDGIQMAFAYLQATWRRWLPMVALVAVSSFLVYLLVYLTVGMVNTADLYHIDRYTGEIEWNEADLRKYVTGMVAAASFVGLVSLVASWVFYATAITGLRHRPLTLDGVVVRGLLALVAHILIGVVAFVAIIGLVILTAIVTVLVPPLGAILILIEVLAAVPVALYLTCRLILTDMAIFDGFGPIEGIRESWRLSNGAVLRLLGWGVMAALITWAFGLIAGMVSLPFSFGALAPVGQGFSSGMTAVASCLTIYMMAIIYESQRARLDPTVYGPVPAPAYTGWGYPGPGPVWPGAAGAPPAWPSAPGTPPAWPGAAGAPPAWPGAAGTPSPWPSPPADSTAIPGWVNPNAAPSWPQSAPPGWGQPAPGWPQSAPPGWGQPAPGSAPKPEEGGQTPPSAPKPPEPPASS